MLGILPSIVKCLLGLALLAKTKFSFTTTEAFLGAGLLAGTVIFRVPRALSYSDALGNALLVAAAKGDCRSW